MALLDKIKSRVTELKSDIVALYLAARDPRTPWYAKAFVVGVVAYALSPIDLIPDPIPILGYLDDLILLPLGIYIAIKLIPPEVLAACRAKASTMRATLPRNWRAAAVIILLWIVALALALYWFTGIVGASFKPASTLYPSNFETELQDRPHERSESFMLHA